MAAIPKRVADRLTKEVPGFQKVLTAAKNRDVNESDTVTLVVDMLGSVFGFDKYSEVTSEQAIRGTYCDLAVQLDGKLRYLIEVKAIGLSLKDNHLRQAVNYGANQGIPWVVLTNGIRWEVYRIKFEKPVSHEEVLALDFLDLSARKSEDRDRLFLLSREGLAKAAIEEYHAHVQTVNKFVIGALIQSDDVVTVLRRELRKLTPISKVSENEIRTLLPEVLKREVLEGAAATHAARKVQRMTSKPKKSYTRDSADSSSTSVQADKDDPRADDASA